MGMGDCSPDIKNITNTVNNTLNENIKQTMMSVTSNTSIFSKSRQSYNMGQINAIGCSINTGPISQDMQVSTNFQQMSKVVTKRSYDQDMKAAIDTAVKSDTEATTGFMSAGANVTNTTNNYNSNINKVLDSFNYSSFQSLMQEMDQAQEVGYAGFNMICTPTTKVDPSCGANLCVGGVTQHMVISLIASQIADTMTETVEKIVMDGRAKVISDNKTKVVATGMFQDFGTAIGGIFTGMASFMGMAMFGPIFMILGFILVIVIGIAVFRWATGSKAADVGMAAAAACRVWQIDQETGLETDVCLEEEEPLGDENNDCYDDERDDDGYCPPALPERDDDCYDDDCYDEQAPPALPERDDEDDNDMSENELPPVVEKNYRPETEAERINTQLNEMDNEQ
jgi:uncharacterized membrane protein